MTPAEAAALKARFAAAMRRAMEEEPPKPDPWTCAHCAGRMRCYSTRVVHGRRKRFLRCCSCDRPAAHAQIVPLEFAPARPKRTRVHP